MILITMSKMESGIDCIGIGCRAIVVNDKDRVLLVRRSDDAKNEPGSWSCPGEKVEFGEKIEDADEREVEEETNVKCKIKRLLEITQNIDKEKGKHWIAVSYLAEYVSGEEENREPDKHDEIRWFLLDNLPDNLANYTVNSLKRYKELRGLADNGI